MRKFIIALLLLACAPNPAYAGNSAREAYDDETEAFILESYELCSFVYFDDLQAASLCRADQVRFLAKLKRSRKH